MGCCPSNEGRGYVLRRIIRRAVRHGYQLGGETPFFYKLVAPLAKEMGEAYPELYEKREQIEQALRKEEIRFSETLEQGLKIFEQRTAELKDGIVPGELVFLLYDTYGFPADLTADVARERDLVVDDEGFKVLMEQQRQRARSSSKFSAQEQLSIDVKNPTDFIGYNHLKGKAKVLALHADGVDCDAVNSGQSVAIVLDSTPFYAEGGGQVGDQGVLLSEQAQADIDDCQKLANGAFAHFAKITKGELKIGDEVEVQVDPEARYATAANHSATHLMHAALKKVLGAHVQQRGSLVAPNRFRFDFSHDAPLTDQQISQVEELVNAEIFSQHPVESATMPIDQAKAAGAEALFGEKYGAEVRVISMGDFTLELCGGTHVANTSEIGLFKIVAESGVAAGVRRIEAVTRRAAMQWANEQHALLKRVSTALKSAPANLEVRVEHLQSTLKTLEADKKNLQKLLAQGGGGQDIASAIKQVGDVQLVTLILDGADKQLLRDTIDRFKDKHENGIIVLGAEFDGKVTLMAGVAKAISKTYPAGKLIQHITALEGGRGGGRPDMAEGGIADAAGIQNCLDAVEDWVAGQ